MSHSPVIVKRSRTGLGLVANTHFKKDAEIIEYTGTTLTTDAADERGGSYLFQLNKDYVIDGSPRSNTARYINHSCKPNAYAELNETETRIFIKAKRAITPAEEITINYGKDYFNRQIAPQGCRCQSCLGE